MGAEFADQLLRHGRPDAVRQIRLPLRVAYTPSPADWRDEVIYSMLPDRFNDGGEDRRPMLDPSNPAAHRPAGFCLDRWAEGVGGRF